MGAKWGSDRTLAVLVYATLVVVALLAIGGGCGDDDDGSSTTEANATPTGAATSSFTVPRESDALAAAEAKCKQVKAPKLKPVSYEAPPQTVESGEKLTAVVNTTCGTFEIALDTDRSPKTVNSFVFLARKGFYEGLAFDEAAPGTYLHAGDPPGDATGPGYTVKEEVPERLIYRHQIVAMAQPGKVASGVAGSQFFVVLAKPWIDTNEIYPPLGKVSKGLAVLKRINALGPPDRYPGSGNVGVVGTIEKLRRPVLIEQISIEQR
jgi:cyclophilin family peptidyl-prolyl cis-trans isomerase